MIIGRRISSCAFGIFLLFLILLSMQVAGVTASAQVADQSKDDQRARLEAELREVEAQIANQQQLVEAKQGERQTLERDMAILDAKIKKAQLSLKARTIEIQKLGTQIGNKQIVINELSDRQERQKRSLAQLLRKTNEVGDFTLVEVVLGNTNLSKFFEDADQFDVIRRDLRATYSELNQIKGVTAEQKVSLEEKQSTELELKQQLEKEKLEVEKRESEKSRILKTTKGEEAKYQSLLKEHQQKAAQINAELFRLRGVEGGIPFSDALAYARVTSRATGVRPAFILGILRQESSIGENLGTNVGQCLLSNAKTGDGIGKNTGTPFPAMIKVDRDVGPFLDLMTRLGRDPYTTAVSCSQPGGYGGAMGIMQFIPSTWLGFEGRIKATFGTSVADPWNPQHAIMATGIYLQEAGGARGGDTAEREAAGRYYAGGGWATRGVSYAASVLGHAARYQANIDFLDNQ